MLLDLFCGAGGCAVGYHRAGFDVVGLDHRPQPRYPFPFILADALEYVAQHGREYDAIHASPPCQAYSRVSFTQTNRERHPDLLAPTRAALIQSGLPWVIENVDGAPVQAAIKLCGLMFGLKVFRHRWFESSSLLLAPAHPSHRGKIIGKDGMCCCVGHGGGTSKRMRSQMRKFGRKEGLQGNGSKAEWQAAMDINWMTRSEMSQAIPPAYTEFIGRQLIRILAGRHQ